MANLNKTLNRTIKYPPTISQVRVQDRDGNVSNPIDIAVKAKSLEVILNEYLGKPGSNAILVNFQNIIQELLVKENVDTDFDLIISNKDIDNLFNNDVDDDGKEDTVLFSENNLLLIDENNNYLYGEGGDING